MYTELTIGNETYKLRLTTRTSINLEKALGYNPLNLLMEMEQNKMPKMGDMIIVLQAMLQSLHHGFNVDKTMDLFDAYVEDGHSMFDLIPVFVEVFEKSGYISKPGENAEGEEKN